jgi:hypothetical protein
MGLVLLFSLSRCATCLRLPSVPSSWGPPSGWWTHGLEGIAPRRLGRAADRRHNHARRRPGRRPGGARGRRRAVAHRRRASQRDPTRRRPRLGATARSLRRRPPASTGTITPGCWCTGWTTGSSPTPATCAAASAKPSTAPPTRVRWLVFDAEALIGSMRDEAIAFVVARLKDPMRRTFRDVGLLDVIGQGHLYPTVRAAVQAACPERQGA